MGPDDGLHTKRLPETMMHESSVLESVLVRDRTVVITGLVILIALSWVYILLGAGMRMTAFEMTTVSMPDTSSATEKIGDDSRMTAQKSMVGTMRMAHSAMMQPAVWTPAYAALMFLMWWIMMVAMMLPSASPMILLFARVQSKEKNKGAPFISTSVFAAGYLVMWGVFSVFATSAQWGFERAGLLSAMMTSTSGLFAGLLLLAAGIYQLTPLKHACLRHCRSPIEFIMHHWRNGPLGAFRMGLDHGVFCLACCWFLMALLFVGGVMNLYWIVGLALFVLLEKTIPVGHWLGSITGIGLSVWGVWLLAGTLL
jgi:predicted metal-binding membrane protein